MQPSDEDLWRPQREALARYWANITPEQRVERRRKTAETKARNRARWLAEEQAKRLKRERRAERVRRAKEEAEARQKAEAEAEKLRWRGLTRAQKAKETRARTIEALNKERLERAHREDKRRASQERRRQRRQAAVEERMGPPPVFVPVYVPTHKDGPPPEAWERVPAEYVLRRRRRFWVYVEDTGRDACWPWHGSMWFGEGYGQSYWMGRSTAAHRVAWMLTYRLDIPPLWVGDHMCLCRWCVNPFHIEPVPHGENVRRQHRRPEAATRTRTSWSVPEHWRASDLR